MPIELSESGTWYHGSNMNFEILEAGSTITQWKALAEAFSHKPPMLCCDDNGVILHNGKESGFLYIIDEQINVDKDIYQHPKSTMDDNVEFLTKRALRVRVISNTGKPTDSAVEWANKEFERMISQHQKEQQ